MEVYNKNRDKNTSVSDEIKEQNAKMKNAPFKEKLGYFMDYYFKITLAIIAGAALIISIIVTIATGPDDIGFAAYFFNNAKYSTDTALQDEFITYAGINTKEHDAYIDTTLYYSGEIDSQEVLANIEKSVAVLSTGELDIIVGDEAVLEYFGQMGCPADVTTVLPDDLMEKFKDDLYYYTHPETGKTYPAGIYVTNAPKLMQYGYYTDQKPILTFISNSDSLDNAILFLRYLYTE